MHAQHTLKCNIMRLGVVQPGSWPGWNKHSHMVLSCQRREGGVGTQDTGAELQSWRSNCKEVYYESSCIYALWPQTGPSLGPCVWHYMFLIPGHWQVEYMYVGGIVQGLKVLIWCPGLRTRPIRGWLSCRDFWVAACARLTRNQMLVTLIIVAIACSCRQDLCIHGCYVELISTIPGL